MGPCRAPHRAAAHLLPHADIFAHARNPGRPATQTIRGLIMRNISRLASGLFILAALAAPITAAHAQSLRTWVSGTGSDGNACTRGAPCLTFNHAHAVTAAGGEINCVDAGDF